MTEQVTISLVDRDFRLACEPEERDGLLQAAEFLDKRMRELRHASRSPGFDRLAVLAAMDITNELLQLRDQEQDRGAELAGNVARLRERMDQALANTPDPL